MKLLLNLIFCSIITCSLYAQGYSVEYAHTISYDESTLEATYKLRHMNKQSIYYELSNNITNLTNNGLEEIEGEMLFVKKDYSQKRMIYNQPIIDETKIIEERLLLQEWTFHHETKKIQAFNCKKATTTFRGRSYTAWYTQDAPVVGGPWKFDGLPGLILDISSDDGVFSLLATKIQTKDTSNLPDISHKKSAIISWEDYCKDFRKYVNRIKRNFKADTDPEVAYNLKINTIEDVGL